MGKKQDWEWVNLGPYWEGTSRDLELLSFEAVPSENGYILNLFDETTFATYQLGTYKKFKDARMAAGKFALMAR